MKTSSSNKKEEIQGRVENIRIWLEGLDNENKRKIVSALKRSKEASENGNSSKLKKAQETFGASCDLQPVLVKSERFGKDRFSLEFLPSDKLHELENSNEWLTPDEALELANSITLERATYPQRLKLAFIYLSRKQGIKNYKAFRYSVDGEHYTKAYASLESVPEGEETIGFDQAYKIVLEDSQTNPNSEKTEIYQTKVFRVSLSSLESGEVLAFEKCQPEESPIPRANYRLEIFPSRSYRNLKRTSNYKLLWPTKQENALFCLMDACQDLILQCSSSTLGHGEPYYATIFERYAEIGPEGILYKALITNSADKKSASQKSTENVEEIWKGFNSKAKPVMCLHSKECHWICQLVEES